MTLQQQMIAANIRNWLSDLATGAKAMSVTVQYAPSTEDTAWRYEASVWDRPLVDEIVTVYIHNIKAVAEAAELEVHHRNFNEDDFYYRAFSGEDFFIFNDVKFSNMTGRKENVNEGQQSESVKSS